MLSQPLTPLGGGGTLLGGWAKALSMLSSVAQRFPILPPSDVKHTAAGLQFRERVDAGAPLYKATRLLHPHHVLLSTTADILISICLMLVGRDECHLLGFLKPC